MSLKITNLYVEANDREIISGLSLTINPGEVHALMGPNGSGKSTLAGTLMGNPRYSPTQGSIILDDTNITTAKPEERARHGLFLSPQYPPEIAGVTISNFLRLSKSALTGAKINPLDWHKGLMAKMAELKIDPAFAQRSINVDFSGGEKKRVEILQLAVLQPKYAILDETDSGLDVDALRIVAEGVNQFRSREKGILLITHYNRILEYVVPDFVHVLDDGKIVQSGGPELAREIEERGYRVF